MALTKPDDIEVVVLSAWHEKRRKRGAPANDWFRWWHKKLGAGWYAADLDLVIHSKSPSGICAMLDFKGPDEEGLSFSHVQVYNGLMRRWRVYLVELQNQVTWRDVPMRSNGQIWTQRVVEIDEEDEPRFLISRYIGGDWRPDPPLVALTEPLEVQGLNEWRTWERSVRHEWVTSVPECRLGDHRWEPAGSQLAPWGPEFVLSCAGCGLRRFRDRSCEGPAGPPP